MMLKDDWKAVYTKDDDLKLTKAGGNKIRRTTTKDDDEVNQPQV